MGEDVSKPLKDDVDKALKEGYVIVYVNKIFVLVKSEKNAGKVRNGLREKMKSLRACVGKDVEKHLMGETLHSKVHSLLAWKAG